MNPTVDQYGTERWFNEKGQIHRDGGPAETWTDGSKLWYKHSELHREDGPAIEWGDGTNSWYLNNIIYSAAEYLIVMRNKKINELLELI